MAVTLQVRRPRPAVFLDKDGTVVTDVPFNVDPAKLQFTPGALSALKLLSDWRFALFIVSNQSGLAYRRFSSAQFACLREALLGRIRAEAQVTVEGVYICPHKPGDDGRPVCNCRKPEPGLLLRAAKLHQIDLQRSWMIGDILDDVEAGHRAGCRTILLDNGHEDKWMLSPTRIPDYTCPDLLHAACTIVALEHLSNPQVRSGRPASFLLASSGSVQ